MLTDTVGFVRKLPHQLVEAFKSTLEVVNDADLLGIPIRLTVGGKGLKNGVVEMKLRRNGEQGEIALGSLVADVAALVEAEVARVNAKAVPMPFEG